MWPKRILLAAGVSLLLSSQLIVQSSLLEFSIGEMLESTALYFFDILLVAGMMVSAVTLVDTRWPVSGFARNAALPVAVVASVLTGMAIEMVFHYGAGPYPPENYLLGESVRWIAMGGAVTLIYETIRRHHRLKERLQQAELRHTIVDNEMIATRLKIIEAQIEPHFLFNTLATVKRLYRTEPVDGARMMDRLAEYLEAALPQMRDGLPTLTSERQQARAYLDIMKVRLGSRLEFAIDSSDPLPSPPFPAMTIVTLIENAIKHGLNPLPDGGRVEIEVFETADTIAVEVRDNGVGLQAGAGTSGTGIGLANIRSRLAALYGDHATLVLRQNEPQGLIARVEVSKRVAQDVAAQLTAGVVAPARRLSQSAAALTEAESWTA